MPKETNNIFLKTTDNSFLKIPSVVQIVVAQIIAVWGATSFITAIWNTIKPGTFGEMTLRGIGNWVWFLLGIFLLGWSLWQMLAPKIKGDTGGFIWKSRYLFCSTHPSYIFLDLILPAFFGFLYWYAKGINSDSKVYQIMLILSGIFPVIRLFAWYLLRLKIESPAVEVAWKPVAWFLIPVFTVFAITGAFGIYNQIQYPKMLAHLPVIDEKTFADSRAKFKELLEKNGDDSGPAKVKTNFVRLRAKQSSDAPMQCKNKQGVDFATVLADLGADNDVLIVAANYDNGGFDELLAKAKDNQGKEIEVIGKLREMPSKSLIEDWKAYCELIIYHPCREIAGFWKWRNHNLEQNHF